MVLCHREKCYLSSERKMGEDKADSSPKVRRKELVLKESRYNVSWIFESKILKYVTKYFNLIQH